MANNIYGAIALIGGAAGALDNIDGTGLIDKDIAVVAVQGDMVYTYTLSAASGAAESSPEIISPDTNAGTKRWILTRVYGGHRKLITSGSASINNNAVANTLQDVTDMSFPVLAGTTYRFHFHICFTSASTSTGGRFVLNGPAAPTNFAASYSWPTAAATISSVNATDFTTPSASLTSSLLTNIVIIDGFIKPSINGTVQLQFASEVAASAITILAGSTIEVW